MPLGPVQLKGFRSVRGVSARSVSFLESVAMAPVTTPNGFWNSCNFNPIGMQPCEVRVAATSHEAES